MGVEETPWTTAIVIAVSAAAAAAGLWLGVLQPLIRTEATNAGTTAAQQTVRRLMPGAPPGSRTALPSPSPSPPAPAPTARASPAPVPFTQALRAASPELTARANHVMSITDLVFENPAGDQGMLTVSRSGQVLFSEQLADFRDYDLHFITPIMVPAGQSLTLSVSCANPGGKACTPAVLLSGTQSAG